MSQSRRYKDWIMQMLLVAVLTTAALAAGLVATAEAAERRVKATASAAPKRDCTPINGRFGYYGNPWCDTGSYRLEDIEFRQRQLKLRNANARAGE